MAPRHRFCGPGSRRSVGAVLAAMLIPAAAPAEQLPLTRAFSVVRTGEAVVALNAACAPCDWGTAGREAVALRLLLDGRYSQHVLLVRGDEAAEYQVVLGPVQAGRHALRIERDERLSAAGAGHATVTAVDITVVSPGDDEFEQVARAPILFARADTVGRFTDLPVLMYAEATPTARGHDIRYTVIFTNEDGGTPADRLMATWGRTTDIEFVYGAELDASGRVLAEHIQAPGHAVPEFTGSHEAGHPLLWVVTDNNMVDVHGRTRIRYAPAPERFVPGDRSREAFMDAHPWTYAATAAELAREGTVDPDARPGSGRIPDARRFLIVEACSDLQHAALALSVGLEDDGRHTRWYDADRGVPDFRISRPGCARGAVPVKDVAARVVGVRVRAFEVSPAENEASHVRVRSISRVFALDEHFQPGPSRCRWSGDADLEPGGPWRVLPCE